jgi:Sulfotransferase family
MSSGGHSRAFDTVGSPRSVYNYCIRFPRLKLLYFETPKCASTSIKKFLFSQERGLPMHVHFGLGHFTWMHLFPECICENAHRELLAAPGSAFAVVRSPWARLYSGYRYLPVLTRQFGEVLTPEPRDFRDFVLRLPETLHAPWSDVSVNHFRPASEFIPRDSEGCPLCPVFRLEELGLRFLPFLHRVAGISHQALEEFPHLNATGVTGREVLREAYDEEMEQVVRILYRDDLEIGRYG